MKGGIIINQKIFSRIFWMFLNKSFQREITKVHNKTFSKETMILAKENYYRILGNTPSFVKRNPKLVDILFTALVAAIYMAGGGKISITQMDDLMKDSMESSYVFRKSFEKDDHFSKKWQDKRNQQALLSKQRRYPSDFVCDFIYGATSNQYGINYYECAIFDILKREGCPELTSLFCKFDYIMAMHMKATLKRTKTIVTGGDCCDFWYTKD